ncbi:MAG: sugar phosphate isomerase/epimerase [Acidobacteriota bacterium]|nr:MAG: sugar phosphate isomerase/epimerase [Acidobacteriota bacterium]
MEKRGYLRRDILKGTIAVGLLPSLSCVSNSESEKRSIRLAVRGPFPETDLQARAELLSRLGYEGIELGPEYLDQPAEEILNQLKGTGISVSAIVGSIRLLDPDPAARKAAVELDRKRLLLAEQLGAVGVIEVPTFGDCRFEQGDDKTLENEILVEGLKGLATTVDQTGVKILLEPLTRKETHYLQLQSHGVEIIQAVGQPGFALLSDFYHMQMEEADIAQTLKTIGMHSGYIHMADGEARTEPGSLPFDYRPGFRALKDHGYRGWLTVESGATDTPEAALGRAREYILKQWDEA